ncbi:MAG: aminopeptidase P family protein [Clostridia bacterium]|nr:aminopeptidase P family protein [Clostridia bacterium]
MDKAEKLISKLDKNSLVYITTPENIKYFSGVDVEGCLIITNGHKAIVTDGRYTEVAKSNACGFEVVEDVNHSRELKKFSKKVLFEPDISYLDYEKLKAADLKTEKLEVNLDFLRSVKDEQEIAYLKEAAEIAEKALVKTLEVIKPGVTENFVKATLEYNMALLGGEKTSFDTICISGTKTSLPHGTPSDKVIEKGDFLTIDFGCRKNGYCSDMTRTFAIGTATDEMKEVYETVLKAQLAATEFIKAGIKCSDCDKVARDIIKNAGYGEKFRHSLGHGVGLKIHEMPVLSPKSDSVLENGNIVTVEPGIYIEGKMGVRIENTVIVTDEKCIELQKMDKNLIIL